MARNVLPAASMCSTAPWHSQARSHAMLMRTCSGRPLHDRQLLRETCQQGLRLGTVQRGDGHQRLHNLLDDGRLGSQVHLLKPAGHAHAGRSHSAALP
jgi:hypothetical protein